MLVLFDHSTPAPLRYALKAHIVVETIERGWERLENGALLDAAEAATLLGYNSDDLGRVVLIRQFSGALDWRRSPAVDATFGGEGLPRICQDR